eukprot:TRINITY_DN5065_c0_g1_i1.p1 TRINITY_DN5065_c0_g1~~TRINITY_DN5065_c0_g1_i1.p1  ORF type:complete len:1258 (+),score=327.93 TRINITY_DN5065_c0_g1_i1:91-3864(+)
MERGTLTTLIKRNFVPVVLILYTDDVEQICKKSNTNLIQLFSKFGFSSQSTKVRTIGEQPYEIKGFQLRFTSLSELEGKMPPTKDTGISAVSELRLQDHLADKANEHSPTSYVNQPTLRLRDKQSVATFLKAITNQDPTPWYSAFRWEYLRTIGASEVEYFEHPVACILAVSSNEEKPTEAILSLFDDRSPPPIFKTGLLDPALPKFYLLIHDAHAQTSPDKKLTQMKAVFEKSKCQMLTLNSLEHESAEVGGGGGGLMSTSDMQQIEAYVRDLMFKGIIPQMEKQISVLNEYVENSRKNFKSLVKGIFGFRKPKSDKAVPETEPGTFSLTSVECSQKKLGDYLLMLQDYSEALNVYKNSSKDYLNDKSYKFYAASQELAGVAQYMIDPAKRDLETYFDNAYLSYVKDKQYRFAIRSTMLGAEVLKNRRAGYTSGVMSSAPQVQGASMNNAAVSALLLVRAAEREEDRLTAAMLHEQSAFCFLYSSPPQLRKFAFRIVLAGHCYLLSNQSKHAMRCYSVGWTLYTGKGWAPGINEHMLHTQARLSFSLGELDNAVSLIQQLISENSRNSNKQSTYLREFLNIVAKTSENGTNLPVLPVPRIVNEGVVVHLRDYPPKSPTQEMWQEMEYSLKQDMKPISNKYKPQKPRKNLPRFSVIGEVISIDVEISNPLQVPLQFTQMRLLGSHTPVTGQEQDPSQPPSPSDNNDAFQMTPFDLLLGPNESKKLNFHILPMKEGMLTISAIGFTLCGSVNGCAEFNLNQRRLNDTSDHKRGVYYQPNLDLTIRITAPMPLLDVEISKFPTHMLQGQLEKVNVIFTNSGKSNLRNVRVKFSHPSFFCFEGTREDRIQTPPPKQRNRNVSGIELIPIDTLAAGEARTISMWIRAHKVDQHSFNFLFFYQSEIANPEMKYRLQRISKNLRVLNSLKAGATATLSYSSINAYLLNLETSNVQGNAEFYLKQLTCIAPNSVLQPLSLSNPQDTEKIHTIGAEQSTSLFYRIVPAKDETKTHYGQTGVYQTDYALYSSSEPSADLTKFPYYDFLVKEKYYLADKSRPLSSADKLVTPVQVGVEDGTLDLILTWETRVNSPEGQPLTIVGQHNICNVSFLENTGKTSSTPLRFFIESPRKIVHDFTSQSFCGVAVKFHVNNRSTAHPLSFKLETLKPHEQLPLDTSTSTPNLLANPQKRSQYFWAGTTQHMVTELRPEGNVELDTTVCFSKAGIYNLNRFKFAIVDKTGKHLQQVVSPFQHIIVIQDLNELAN